MSLRLGDVAPNFTADTTHGMINFYEWMSNSWTVLLSHPKDFIQVCTSELIWLFQHQEEFSKRNVKVISLSVDKLIQHSKWIDDIKSQYEVKVSTPLISDKNMRIAKLYGMIQSINNTLGDALNSTARSTYIISPDKKVSSIQVYPASTGRNFDEVIRLLDSLLITSAQKASTPANWVKGDDYIKFNSAKNQVNQVSQVNQVNQANHLELSKSQVA
jgi:alkyl hydroperoxide reductase subunit AhpC